MILGNIPIRPYGVSMYLVNTPASYTKLTGSEVCTGAVGLCGCTSDGGAYVLGIFRQDVGTIVHEVVHVAVLVLVNAGIMLVESDSEPLAYLVDDLTQEVLKLCARKGVPVKLC